MHAYHRRHQFALRQTQSFQRVDEVAGILLGGFGPPQQFSGETGNCIQWPLTHRHGGHRCHQAQHNACEGGVGTGQQDAQPDQSARNDIGVGRTHADLLQPDHH
ncbi:hypothetical protein D3C81_1664110 [compost metagenome]